MFTDKVVVEIKTISEAPNYNTIEEKFIPVKIEKCVIVKAGMQSGMPSYDLQMVDEKGNKYVAFVTGNIMQMMAMNP
jgi:hypothetical protein